MEVNEYGICFRTEQELIDGMYRNPSVLVHKAISELSEQQEYNNASERYYFDQRAEYCSKKPDLSLDEFHKSNQDTWFMPDDYKSFNIHQFLIDSCKNDAELHRIAYEIGLFEDRDLLPLLRYIKYLVDTMREHKIVWGVGRGSASSSYVLFKIGVHKVDSIKYNLDVSELFKE